MRIAPFYSARWYNDPLRDVWHNNDQCRTGQAIAAAERRPGTDHVREHCRSCAVLNEAEASPPDHA